MGVPIGGAGLPLNGANIWNTDTIIQRTSDIPIGVTPTSPNLQMQALQLESTVPVTIGAFTGPVFISLQCNDAASCAASGGTLSAGTMTIHGNTGGGTFDSSLDVFFDVCSAPRGRGSPVEEGSIQRVVDSSGS